MATIAKPHTFSAGGSIIASHHNSNFDLIYTEFNGNISNSNIDSSASIADTKLSQISTASKVSGAALSALASIPSGAGSIPAVNLAALYPIGCIYTTTVSTNPATVFGFGTWSAFGAGKVLVGLDSGDTDFDTVEETGGAKTVNSAHTHTIPRDGWGSTATNPDPDGRVLTGNGAANAAEEAANDVTSGSGGSATLSIVQPYIVVYFFKRTA
jgi:hypothetical protein